MVSHNIEGVPSKSKEAELLGSGKEAVYLSVSGNLSALFLVELTADANVKYWAKQAMRHNLCLILRTVDPMITLHRMAELFDIPQESVKIIPARMQPEYDAETEPVESMSASMACNGSFCGMAQLIIGAKVLRHAAAFGVFIQAVTILLGLGLVLLEVLLHVGLTPGWMLVLQCAATLVTLLAVNIRRIS
jgi:Cu+-exporting ATPase